MSQIHQLNFRQQRAIEAVERAASDFDTVIQSCLTDPEVLREARESLLSLTEILKAAIARSGQ